MSAPTQTPSVPIGPPTPVLPSQQQSPAMSPIERPPVQETRPVPENWKVLFRELTTYYRHLPELLAEGDAGRYVVVKGDKLYLTWDTCGDANQYGLTLFGDELFMIHLVDPRDLDRLAPYFPAKEAPCQL